MARVDPQMDSQYMFIDVMRVNTTTYLSYLQVKEGIGKLLDGVDFGARGLRLLGSDTVSAFKLIGRAAAGGRAELGQALVQDTF